MIIREKKPRKRRQFLYTAWEVQFQSSSFQHFILMTNVFGLIVPVFSYFYFTKFNLKCKISNCFIRKKNTSTHHLASITNQHSPLIQLHPVAASGNHSLSSASHSPKGLPLTLPLSLACILSSSCGTDKLTLDF